MFDEFFAKAHELLQQGTPFATAVVVRAENPTSGRPGDKAIITADGTMYGWIGGSCAQPTVVREALEALRTGESVFIRLSPDPLAQPPRPGLRDVALTCFSGGTLEIYIEAQQPRPALLIVGHLPIARALAELGRAMNYRVTLVDLASTGPLPPYADLLLRDLTDIPAHVTPSTAIVVATHGEYDELALEQALQTEAGYIGLVASRPRAAAVHEYLLQQGVSDQQRRRWKAPAGLNIGARRGDEIALSIMAEIVQHRRAAAGSPEPAGTIAVEVGQGAGAPLEETAIDPVCGMQVATAGAKHTYDYEGVTYYFCCPGCKTTFRRDPQPYLAVAR